MQTCEHYTWLQTSSEWNLAMLFTTTDWMVVAVHLARTLRG